MSTTDVQNDVAAQRLKGVFASVGSIAVLVGGINNLLISLEQLTLKLVTDENGRHTEIYTEGDSVVKRVNTSVGMPFIIPEVSHSTTEFNLAKGLLCNAWDMSGARFFIVPASRDERYCVPLTQTDLDNVQDPKLSAEINQWIEENPGKGIVFAQLQQPVQPVGP